MASSRDRMASLEPRVHESGRKQRWAYQRKIIFLLVCLAASAGATTRSPQATTTAVPATYPYVSQSENTTCNPSDYTTLFYLYQDTNGDSWTNNTGWTSTTMHCCEYYGVSCSSDLRVTGLALAGNGLSGTLAPYVFTDVPNLISLDLSNNRIHGLIPSSIASLKYLQVLRLNYNVFRDTLSPNILFLPNLQELSVRDNGIFGSIPSNTTLWKSVRSLQILDLSINAMNGTIPAGLGQATSLQSLVLAFNIFTGTIPVELGMLKQLTMLDLSANALAGTVPSSLGILLYPILPQKNMTVNLDTDAVCAVNQYAIWSIVGFEGLPQDHPTINPNTTNLRLTVVSRCTQAKPTYASGNFGDDSSIDAN